VSITAADIPIPTTLSLHDVVQRLPSREEARKRRAQQARHQTAACPHCGEWAIVETVTVNRPGLPGVVQTLSRCQRNPRWKEERCPLTILSEEWAPEDPALSPEQAQNEEQADGQPEYRSDAQDANPAPAGAEEETMTKTRPCADCGKTIEDTHGRLRCPECALVQKRALKRAQCARTRAAKKALGAPARQPERPKLDAPRPAPPVPAALRVSVLTLAQQATDPSTRALLRDALALSPERQDLLRRLLDDVEAA
jgi:DNA-directed RNA polymerase subunit RPC12/RpoP